MQVWIGTSGYSYTDWVGAFYPPGTRSGRMLAYYSQHFPLIELNFSFYRLPTGPQLVRLAEQTPPGFQFLVKLPRTLSHDRDPRELAPFREAVEALRQRGRLQGLLCQLPQATHHDRDALVWLNTLATELAEYGMAVEFRHRSWVDAEVVPWLQERRLDLVSVDVPELPGLYPRGLVQSGPHIYVRFHSRAAGKWYAGDKERYDYHYSDAELTEWVTALQSAASRSQRAALLFNNCQGSHAVQDAQRMRQLLCRLAPELALVAPPQSQQRTLFD
jgi:uncharacterized protein YecE (DUF72 family)